MARRLAATSLLVPDYDEAIAFFTRTLRFTLIEDTPLSPARRWVVVAPGADAGGGALLLARADTDEQRQAIGRQAAGRVFLFLHTDDFEADHAHLLRHGVRFVEAPRDERYGRVAVFLDPWGNRWDLVQPATQPPRSAAAPDENAEAAPAGRPDGFRRVAAVLAQRGHPHPPRWLDVAARSAQEAADALGVALGQIAKSVVFRRRADGAAVLVVTSGDRRVDEQKVAARAGALGRADAAFVKAATGFTIGGVSPVAALTNAASPPVTLIDADLFRFDVVWAAAGHPNGVFQASPGQLAALTGAPVADVVIAAEPPVDRPPAAEPPVGEVLP